MLGDIPPIVRGQNYVAVRARKKRSRLRRERPTGPYALSSLEPDICAHQRAFAHHNSVRRTSPAAERRAQYAASTSKSCWESTRKVATLRPHRKRRRGWPLSRRTVPKRGRPRLSDALSRDNGHVERRARVKPEVRLPALLPSFVSQPIVAHMLHFICHLLHLINILLHVKSRYVRAQSFDDRIFFDPQI